MSVHTGKELDMSDLILMPQLERLERKTFARHETFDFANELRKRNTKLIAILDDGKASSTVSPILVAYSVYAHMKSSGMVNLHKICVGKDYRGRGIAKELIAGQIRKLRTQGIIKMQLWVDETNLVARHLYESLGFHEVSRVKDYYAVSRTGIQMALELSS